MADYGVGGDYPRVAQAVTAALQGLAGGDIGSAIAGASAPYLAQVIKKTTGDNAVLNTMAHAVLGAVVAQAQGNSALAGGAGAATGELIAHQLYPGKATADLTQEQKETVSALSGLASGLAGGIVGGDLSGAVTGAQAGTNAVQNNYLSKEQKAQRDAEMAGCGGVGCRTGTATKWMAIDIAQDASFTAGTAAGAVLGLNDTVDSIVHTAGNLKETYAALKAVVESGGVWDAVKQPYIDRIDKLQAQYEEAGASGSFQAGVETGKLLSDMAAVLSAGGGLVKGGALLAEKVAAKVAARAELAGAKATPSGLVSGETGFVDTGKAAANDADFGGAKATGAALEKEASGFFGQQRKYWSQEPIQFNGNKVYQRNDLVDPSRVDSQTGLTNLDLMKNGLAPYGPDGKKVNLHHMLQTQNGPIAEVTQSFHQKNSGSIHINSGSDIPSGINRSQFEKWKKEYWKSRAGGL